MVSDHLNTIFKLVQHLQVFTHPPTHAHEKQPNRLRYDSRENTPNKLSRSIVHPTSKPDA